MTTVPKRGRVKPGMVDIGDGVTIPEEFTVKAEGDGWSSVLTAVYDPQAGRYRTRAITIEATGSGEVTGEMLRGVRVAELLHYGTMDQVAPYLAQASGRSVDREFLAGGPQDLAAAGPTTQTLTYVAMVYRLALLLGDSPTSAVASRLGIPRSTAGRWVTRARDRGLLTVVDKHAGRIVED